VDDQLVEINSESLLGLSNTQAITRLRRAILHCDQKQRGGEICLVFLRSCDTPQFENVGESNRLEHLGTVRKVCDNQVNVGINNEQKKDVGSARHKSKNISIGDENVLNKECSVKPKVGLWPSSIAARNTSYQLATYDELFSNDLEMMKSLFNSCRYEPHHDDSEGEGEGRRYGSGSSSSSTVEGGESVESDDSESTCRGEEEDLRQPNVSIGE